MALRNHLIAHVEEADSECCAVKHPLLTFVVAGGGFAGVETAAGLNDFVRDSLPSYPHLTESMLRIVLVHPGAVILPELGEKLGTYAQKKLGERGVEIRVNTKVEAVSERGVSLSDGMRIETNTLVWTAGTSPNPLLQGLKCMKERGRLMVNEYMEVADWLGVWALGNCAAVPDRTTGKNLPAHRSTRLAPGESAGRKHYRGDSGR
jgi:NADH dehydrogenase